MSGKSTACARLYALDFGCGFLFASFFAFLRDSFTFFLILARWFVDARLEVSAMYQRNTQNVVTCIFSASLRTLPYAGHGVERWLGQSKIPVAALIQAELKSG